MKYDDIIKNTRAIKAPEINKDYSDNQPNKSSLNGFVNQLKATDKKYRNIVRIQQFALGFSTLIYVVLFFSLNYLFSLLTNDIYTLKLGLVLLITAILFSLIMFLLKFKKYNYTTYDADILTFLIDTKKRYSYYTKERLLIIPIFILVDAGLYYTIVPFLSILRIDSLSLLINLQLFLVTVFIFDFFIKHGIWERTQRKIYDEVHRMINQIESDKFF